MIDEEIIQFCIRHRITVEQYFFMWLIVRKDWTLPTRRSLAKQYLQAVGPFDEDVIQDLVDRGFLEDFNPSGESKPEMYMVRDDKMESFYADESAGEQLWNAYPATFPLSNGGSFIARAGGDKDELILTYLKKIRNNPNRHAFVMKQLERYKEKVKKGETNGHKISDWIATEMWNTIAEMDENKTVKFGKDI